MLFEVIDFFFLEPFTVLATFFLVTSRVSKLFAYLALVLAFAVGFKSSSYFPVQ